MADNVTLPVSSGTAVFATDDVAGVHHQRVKITDGTADGTNYLVIDGSGAAAISDNGGSLTVDGSVAVTSAPAGARTTDSISAALATDAIMNGTTALPPKFIGLVASASGATTVVALVAAKKLRILSFTVVCTTAVTVQFRSHTTTAQATGAMPFGANGGTSVPFSPAGHFETVAGEALDIVLGGAVAVAGLLTYVEV